MPLLIIDNFRVKEGKFKQFQEWVKNNRKDLEEWCKKIGWKYRGTYYYAIGTGASLRANGCFMWEISKYADIDTSRGTFKDPLDERISRAMTDLLVSQPMPEFILRPMTEALIYKGM